MKAVIKFNKSNPTVRQRMDVNQLKASYVVDLHWDDGRYWLGEYDNPVLPWKDNHCTLCQVLGNDIRFEVIMTK